MFLPLDLIYTGLNLGNFWNLIEYETYNKNTYVLQIRNGLAKYEQKWYSRRDSVHGRMDKKADTGGQDKPMYLIQLHWESMICI